jgi:hypothetical protein
MYRNVGLNKLRWDIIARVWIHVIYLGDIVSNSENNWQLFYNQEENSPLISNSWTHIVHRRSSTPFCQAQVVLDHHECISILTWFCVVMKMKHQYYIYISIQSWFFPSHINLHILIVLLHWTWCISMSEKNINI